MTPGTRAAGGKRANSFPMKSKSSLRSPITKALLVAATLAALAAPHSIACTALQFERAGQVYLAKNHDFVVGDGLLIVNPRGRGKTGLESPSQLQWSARYGSVTYNQFGREFPNAGMNEAGLVVEMLWLDEAVYPRPDSRPSLGVLQWVQYQLDTARTVGDVLSSDERVRIADPAGKVHFFVTDRSGQTAAIEWLDGKRIVYTGDKLPVAALANDLYADCAQRLTGKVAPKDAALMSMRSFPRFSAVGSRLRSVGQGDAISFAFDALAQVKHPEYTQWQTVYAPTAGKMVMRRKADSRPIEVVFADLDFSSGAKPVAFDLAKPGALAWTACTPEFNERVLTRNYRGTPFLAQVPDAALHAIAMLPEQFKRTN